MTKSKRSAERAVVRAHCGQCGKLYRARACGPTHALIARLAAARKRK